jgi:zinc carboxypeptidase
MKKLVWVFLSLAIAAGAQTKADWATPAEKSDYRTTPNYEETMAYVRRVAAAAPKQVKLETFGRTPEGHDEIAVIVSKDGIFDPAAAHNGRHPILYIQNGIHAGEIDGKDASLALLRDMVITKTQADLLERAIVIIIPIYNIDGHERISPFNRINQNGPEEMGWRTQSQNLNLNRDYLKADAPETRDFLQLWNRWLPDFFVDNHVTDGADYQYDTTYAIDVGPDVFPATATWLENELKPYITKSVTASGHVIGEYVGVGEAQPKLGFVVQQDTPRFSTGYMILQNRPGLLVEQHMLKPYKVRVTGNYELLRAILEVISRDADKLIKNNRDADAATTWSGQKFDPESKFPLRLAATDATVPFHYLGYRNTTQLSEISGSTWVQYTHDPLDEDIPLHATLQPTYTVTTPVAYIVPAQWTRVIDVLRAHGLEMKPTTAVWSGTVQTYRCTAHWQERPFEGHHVLAGNGDLYQESTGLQCTPVQEKLSFPAGSVLVPTAQRAAKVAIHWLEPMGPDSAVQWGLFDSIFEQKEYGEGYVLEKLARDMIAKDPKLKAEFEQKLTDDPKFAGNAYGRLNWFYQHSPWADPQLGLYPVGRLTSLDGIPLGK